MVRISLAMIVALSAGTAFAQEDKANLEQRKSEALANIDERISKLNEHKSCVQAAQSREGMEKCHQAMKEFRNSERMQHMEKRKAKMDERMEKMKAKQN